MNKKICIIGVIAAVLGIVGAVVFKIISDKE